ncbi:hypothetical protein OPV22_008759 [Ensete ventricosum]|uniref:Chlorophyll a-b binding protein, chloroplastic n=1 Tax=Ensete ventricosum TaxID=4639 RepID=A0AAV8RD05_ENSVE|nr:hypothetical protein OPV22_008759 [Ensete ventricosum]
MAQSVEEKTKPKVEDGIFGTLREGVWVTKQNELFVGRVAMLGFAASLLGEGITGKGILAQLNLETGIPIYEAEPLLLFTLGGLGDRGQFVDDPPTGLGKAVIPPSCFGTRGRRARPSSDSRKRTSSLLEDLAQLGIAFSLIGEMITGKGALAQLNIETGVPNSDLEPLVLFDVAFFFFAALHPGMREAN